MDTLPNEIITEIISLLCSQFSTPVSQALTDTANLSHIGRTSRKLQRLAQPLLYRSVVFERLLRGSHLRKDSPQGTRSPLSGLDVLRRRPELGRHIQYIRFEELSIFRLHSLPGSYESLVECGREAKSKPMADFIHDLLNQMTLPQYKTVGEVWQSRELAISELVAMAPNLKGCDLSFGRALGVPITHRFELFVNQEQPLPCLRHINMFYRGEAPHGLLQPNIAPILFLPRLESMTLELWCGWNSDNDPKPILFESYGARPQLRSLKIRGPSLAKLDPISDILRCFPNLENLILKTPLQAAGNGDNFLPLGNDLREYGKTLRRFELADEEGKYERMGVHGGLGPLRDQLLELQQLRVAWARLTGWRDDMGLRDGNRTLHIASHLPATLKYFWTTMGNGDRQNEVAEHTLALEEMFADAADGMLPDLEWVLVNTFVPYRKWNCLPRGWEIDWFAHKHSRMSFYLFRKLGAGGLRDGEVPSGWDIWPVTEFAKTEKDRGRCGCQNVH